MQCAGDAALTDPRARDARSDSAADTNAPAHPDARADGTIARGPRARRQDRDLQSDLQDQLERRGRLGRGRDPDVVREAAKAADGLLRPQSRPGAGRLHLHPREWCLQLHLCGGHALFRHYGLDPETFETVLLLADGRAFGKLEAVREIARVVGGA